MRRIRIGLPLAWVGLLLAGCDVPVVFGGWDAYQKAHANDSPGDLFGFMGPAAVGTSTVTRQGGKDTSSSDLPDGAEFVFTGKFMDPVPAGAKERWGIALIRQNVGTSGVLVGDQVDEAQGRYVLATAMAEANGQFELHVPLAPLEREGAPIRVRPTAFGDKDGDGDYRLGYDIDGEDSPEAFWYSAGQFYLSVTDEVVFKPEQFLKQVHSPHDLGPLIRQRTGNY